MKKLLLFLLVITFFMSCTEKRFEQVEKKGQGVFGEVKVFPSGKRVVEYTSISSTIREDVSYDEPINDYSYAWRGVSWFSKMTFYGKPFVTGDTTYLYVLGNNKYFSSQPLYDGQIVAATEIASGAAVFVIIIIIVVLVVVGIIIGLKMQ